MEQEFNTMTCGMKHEVPKKAADIKLLQEPYHKVKVHDYIKGCTCATSKRERYNDYILNGFIKLQTATTLFNYLIG